MIAFNINGRFKSIILIELLKLGVSFVKITACQIVGAASQIDANINQIYRVLLYCKSPGIKQLQIKDSTYQSYLSNEQQQIQSYAFEHNKFRSSDQFSIELFKECWLSDTCDQQEHMHVWVMDIKQFILISTKIVVFNFSTVYILLNFV